eukprot:TRINITY_DN8999_c0_g2_i1.p1 TRINITY_DN8999_c0_g2~~TRINITY_DN8999_c0_g2_i1.p1  ORF type:complete len:285 (+),score=42.90 TRINITY_DN8999_c0_g2_i1:156-1010(+)
MQDHIGTYTITNFICKCSDGNVYRAVNTKLPNESFAVRAIPNEVISPSKVLSIEREVNILKGVATKNIVKLRDVKATKKHHYLIFEYCDGGDLKSFIDQQQGEISETLLRHILRELVNALDSLHSRSIVHNNLVPNNVLLVTSAETKLPTVKLSDFRLAQLVTPGSYDFHYDILDMGRILQKLICNNCQEDPYYIPKRMDLSKECMDFMRCCFQVNTDKGFTIADAKSHPFVASACTSLLEECDWLLIELEDELNTEEGCDEVGCLEIDDYELITKTNSLCCGL